MSEWGRAMRFGLTISSYARKSGFADEDIDHAISHHQRAVDLAPSGCADLPYWFGSLGDSYLRRFERTDKLKDIDHALSHHQTAFELTPSGHADLPSRFNNLGISYLRRFERTGKLEDLNRAITNHQEAANSTPSGDVNFPRVLSNLGCSYFHRFERTGKLEDINHAISHHQKAVELTPSGHVYLSDWFNNLGISYLLRFDHTEKLEDIDNAISHLQRALELTPSDHDHALLTRRLNNLGTSYSSRFEITGRVEDIEHAISHHQEASKLIPPGGAGVTLCFNNLGNAYHHRFERSGELGDIDHAISHYQKAVESTPADHAVLSNTFQNLGNSYLSRFKRTGNVKDVDYAISHHQHALELTPLGHAALTNRFSSLGVAYSYRFKQTGKLKDIDHAISHHKKAVELTPFGHAQLSMSLGKLGNSYSSRFEHTGKSEDIDNAISHHQKALELTPSGHACRLLMRFINLGKSYSCRFKLTGKLEDIDYAISHRQNALELTPSGHPDLPGFFGDLGNSYHNRFFCTHHFSDIQNGIALYRLAAEARGMPSARLRSASQAALLSSVHDDPHCLNDFALAISLLSEVAGLEQLIDHRHANLHGHSNFVVDAVAYALHCNQPHLALEWLEQGRCLVWNQVNQLRTPVENLRTSNPSLADHFIKVSSALESHGNRSAMSTEDTLAEEIRLQDDTRKHTLCAAEYRQLLEQIRGLPDFHDFLQPPKVANLLSSLPSDGPVIIFNLHKRRCDALAVIAGIEEPLIIPLNDFSLVEAEKLQTLQVSLLKQRQILEDQDRACQPAQHNPPSMAFVLKELWCKVVEPILKALAYSPQPALNRRRIWWCPTGPLSFLPLHAAGVYGSKKSPGSCVSDFVVSSYTPTIRSLKDKIIKPSTSSERTSLLIISQPNTPDLPSIPSTRIETHVVKAMMNGTAINTLLLEDSSATRERVKAEMESRSWVHFACHGVQDVSQPLQSGLCLHDGRLELLGVMRQKMRNPDLAFLSACQTGKGDLKLSNEVVHLSAGMLAAGYRGVVGTMWSISDTHGPDFAQEFYEYLLKDGKGLDSSRAAYALDHATRKVRESLRESDTSFMTWVPYVHFGY